MKVIIPPVHERLKAGADPAELDVFERKKFADNLTNLFSNTSDGLVLTVNSNWGDGKTSFIRLWEKELEADSRFIPIYYDAFSNDFTGDAFLSIAVEIHRSFENEVKQLGDDFKNGEQLKELKKHTKNITKGFLRMGTRMAVSSLTAGMMDSKEVVQKVADGAEKILYGTLEHDAEAKFDSHLNVKKTIEGYRGQLKAMLTLDEKNPKKIVFFVDELDRCRPDFAIQVIEKIKHLFSVDNVFFVLAINKDQLMRTIQSAYGVSEEDSKIYLQKFVHLETNLPDLQYKKITEESGLANIVKFMEKTATEHGILDDFINHSIQLEQFANVVGVVRPSVNPRSLERLFTLITLVFSSCPKFFQKDEGKFRVMTAMAMVKACCPVALFSAWKTGKFVEGSNAKYPFQKELYNMLKEYLEPTGLVKKTARNVFCVDGGAEISEMLDIYYFPEDRPMREDLVMTDDLRL